MKARYLIITVIILLCFVTTGFAEEWKVHTIDVQGRRAAGVRFADVNQDGLLDLVSGWEEAGETRGYLHPGTGQVRDLWPTVTVGESGPVEGAVFCDLDIFTTDERGLQVFWCENPAR